MNGNEAGGRQGHGKLYRIAGYAAIAVAASTAVWILLAGLCFLTRVGQDPTAAGFARAFPFINGWGRFNLIGLVLLQVPVVMALTLLTAGRQRLLSVLGATFGGLYILTGLFAALFKTVVFSDIAGRLLTVSGAEQGVAIRNLAIWAQGHPYSVTYGLDVPVNLLFALMALAFAAAMAGSSPASTAVRWLLGGGAIIGLVVTSTQLVGWTALQGLMMIAAATTIGAYLLLGPLFLAQAFGRPAGPEPAVPVHD
ncbi:MAG TPA: hypothetical protein VGL40_12950 [Bacillota bacterium]|jgi:hypothetical protein